MRKQRTKNHLHSTFHVGIFKQRGAGGRVPSFPKDGYITTILFLNLYTNHLPIPLPTLSISPNYSSRNLMDQNIPTLAPPEQWKPIHYHPRIPPDILWGPLPASTQRRRTFLLRHYEITKYPR